MTTLYHGRGGESMDQGSIAAHHKAYLRETLKRVLSCVDDVTKRDNKPLVFADFGTGDGGLAVKIFEAVRDRLSSKQDDRELIFMLEDQETYDFNKTLQSFRNSPLWGDDKISIMFNGRNMYKRCFSTASLDVVLSSYATMVFDKPPVLLKEELFSFCVNVTEQERELFRNKLIDQWRDFMKARSAELRTGGYLINYVPCVSDETKPYGGWPGGYQMLSDVWGNLCADNTDSSLKSVTFPGHFGLTSDLLDPFQDGVYCGLQLVSVEIVESDVYKYPQKTGDATEDEKHLDEFAEKITSYVKGWMYNGLKNLLPDSLSDAKKVDLLEEYYARLQDRIKKEDLEDSCFHLTEIILKRI